MTLPVNPTRLSKQVKAGSLLDMGRYLTPDDETASVRLEVLSVDSETRSIRCSCTCAALALSQAATTVKRFEDSWE